MRFLFYATIIGLSFSNAIAAPPEGIKISEIIAKIEKTIDFQYINEVEWKERGYYEIEYYTTNGAKVEIKIDPLTESAIK